MRNGTKKFIIFPLIGAKPLRIRFDKVDGFIRAYDGTRCLVLFGTTKFDFISNKIRYLIIFL